QVKGIKQGAKYDEATVGERFWDHAWFIGFAPADKPKIAVVVLVENGKHGSSVAPIARALFDFELLGKLPPPPAPPTPEASDE
ncbi:MAG: penicillin-binding transpeptidase domain-containing protein, partial [Moraxellaceae bacterium]